MIRVEAPLNARYARPARKSEEASSFE